MDDREARERFRLQDEQIKRLSALHAQAEQAKAKSEALEVLIRIMSAAFDRMSAYTSLIVIGGYAAFFSIWSVTEKFVTAEIRLWTFGLMGISVLIFVLSETYRITKYTTEMLAWLSTLKKTPPERFRAQQEELTAIQDRKNLERVRAQRIMQVVIMGLAVLAALILFFGIANTLWKGAHEKSDNTKSPQTLY